MDKPKKSDKSQVKTGKRTQKKLGIYFSNAEHEEILSASKRAGLSISSWIRFICLKEARKEGGEE